MEMMAVVAVIGILASISVSAFGETVQNGRVNNALAGIESMVKLARTHAMKDQKVVCLMHVSDEPLEYKRFEAPTEGECGDSANSSGATIITHKSAFDDLIVIEGSPGLGQYTSNKTFGFNERGEQFTLNGDTPERSGVQLKIKSVSDRFYEIFITQTGFVRVIAL